MLVVGTVALDTIETPFGKVKNALGGSATYASLSASFFTKVKLVSVAGEDFPRQHINLLRSKGIDTCGLEIKKGKTFRWSGRYTYDLNSAETLKTELNLLSSFKPKLNSVHKKEQVVFLANIDPDVQLEVLGQLKNPKMVACDTMNYWIEHQNTALRKIVRKSNILVLNDSEAREFSRCSNLIKAAKTLLQLGPSLVIIKRGEYGCSLFSSAFSFYVPAYLLENVYDPTGAGDTFAGGFLGYLANCRKITESAFKKAVACATVMASYAVEDFSVNRLKGLTKKDIQKRFKSFQQKTRF